MSGLNVREERFARFLASGIVPYRAYPMAGFKPDRGHPYRLAERGRIKRRVEELMADQMNAQNITPEWVLNRLIHEAQNAQEGATRKGSLELLGKYLAMWNADRDPDQMTADELRGTVAAWLKENPAEREAVLAQLSQDDRSALESIEAEGSA